MKEKKKVLMLASVASMIDQFNMPNICLLQDMGYEVHVACNFKEGNTCNVQRIRKLENQLSRMHVVFYQWDCPRGICSVRKCVAAYMQLWILTQCCQYEWIHCQSPVGGVLARLAAHRAGIQVIYTAHGFHFYQGAPVKNWLLYYPAERLLSYWTDLLVTVNQEDYHFAKQNFGAGKVCYIPGVGIDIRSFQKRRNVRNSKRSLREQYRIPKDAVLLLSVGELSRRKNHKAVITALAGLAAQRMNVYYLICGQGAAGKSLARYAYKLGVSERLRMPGFLEDLKKVYQEADLFVFPSYQEGMPVALMEAMAAGMPCIVSDIRGNRELIDSKGLRFAPGQPGQLQEILERLIKDKEYRLACGMYNSGKIAGYDLSVVQKRMEKIYRRLAGSIRGEKMGRETKGGRSAMEEVKATQTEGIKT